MFFVKFTTKKWQKKRLWVLTIMLKSRFIECKTQVENSIDGSLYWIDFCFNIDDVSIFEKYICKGKVFDKHIIVGLKNGLQFTCDIGFDDFKSLISSKYIGLFN